MFDTRFPRGESFMNGAHPDDEERARQQTQLDLYARKDRLALLGPLLTLFAFWALNGGPRRPLIFWKIHGAGTALFIAVLTCLLYFLASLYAGYRSQKARERLNSGALLDPKELKTLRFLHSQTLSVFFVLLVFAAGVLVMHPPERPLPPESRLPRLEKLDEGTAQTHYRSWSDWSAPLQEEWTQLMTKPAENGEDKDVITAGLSLQSFCLRKAADAEALFQLLEQGVAGPQTAEGDPAEAKAMTRRELSGRSGLLLSVGQYVDQDGTERRCAVLCQGKKVLRADYMGAAEEAVWLELLADSLDEMPEP